MRKRIELDLKFRLPEKAIIQLGTGVLVLTEPSFYHIEFVNSLHLPLLENARILLYHLDFKLEDLDELLEFLESLPFGLQKILEDFCLHYFEQDLQIEDNLLRGNLEGFLRVRGFYAQEARDRQTYDHLFNRLFEGFGIYLKARPPKLQDEVEDAPKDFAWIPLTQAINPKAYDQVRSNLSYQEFDEDEFLKDVLEKSQQLENERTEVMADKEPEFAKPLTEIEIQKFEKVGRIPLSRVTSREDYVKMIKEFSNFGYLEVSSKMGIKDYFQMVTENSPELSKDREKLQEEQITIQSRWKGSKKR